MQWRYVKLGHEAKATIINTAPSVVGTTVTQQQQSLATRLSAVRKTGLSARARSAGVRQNAANARKRAAQRARQKGLKEGFTSVRSTESRFLEKAQFERINREAAQAASNVRRIRSLPVRNSADRRRLRKATQARAGAFGAQTTARRLRTRRASGQISDNQFLQGLNDAIVNSRGSTAVGRQQRQRTSFTQPSRIEPTRSFIGSRGGSGIASRKSVVGTTITQQQQIITDRLAQLNEGQFQGDVGKVGDRPTDFVPTKILPPTARDPRTVGLPTGSKFEIIGGKAVPKGSVLKGGNIAFSKVPTISKRTGEPLPQEIIDIFKQQRAVSVRVAQDFVSKRNAAIAGGATIKEANELAKSQAVGLPKSDAEAINTAIQKSIIERKAGQIAEAKRLIAEQTEFGERGDLDDLQGLLDKAEPIPATQIQLSVDSDGNDINPRRTKVLLDNALLTGNSLDDLEIIIHQDPLLKVGDRGGILSILDGELIVDDQRFEEKLNPRSIQRVLGSEQDVLTAILKDVSGSRTGGDLLLAAQKGEITLSPEQITQLTTEGQIAKEQEVIEGQLKTGGEAFTGGLDKLAEDILKGDFILDFDPDNTEIINIFDKGGNIVGTLNNEEFNNLLNKLTEAITANEALAGFNQQLLDIIEGLRGGESSSELLSSLFSIIAALQAQLAGSQQQQETQLPFQEHDDPIGDFFQFLSDVNTGFINFIGGLFR